MPYCTCKNNKRHAAGEANPFLLHLKSGEAREAKFRILSESQKFFVNGEAKICPSSG